MTSQYGSTTDPQIVDLAPAYHTWLVKRWGERALAGIALILVGLPLLALMAAVRLTSAGDAIYRQKRLGLGGKPFEILKLRSMINDAEQKTGAVWCTPEDPRVTVIGRRLRKYHLDELPQLVNILRGEMSFIGPRPERPEMAAKLMHQVPGYAHRLAVLPGVTGLAQVNLPPDETTDCVKRKFELDMEYVFSASVSLDARLVACTVLKMLGAPPAWAARLTLVRRTPRPVPISSAPHAQPAGVSSTR